MIPSYAGASSKGYSLVGSGAGDGGTTLKNVNDVTVIQIGTAANWGQGRLRDFQIDGNYGTQAAGSGIVAYAYFSHFDNVHVWNVQGSGIQLLSAADASTGSNILKGVSAIEGGARDGVDGLLLSSPDNQVIEGYFGGFDGAGINVTSTTQKIVAVHISGCDQGVRVTGVTFVNILDSTIENNYHEGILVETTAGGGPWDTVISNNSIWGNSKDGTNTYSAIKLDTTAGQSIQGSIVTGNMIDQAATNHKYAVEGVGGAVSNDIITNNKMWNGYATAGIIGVTGIIRGNTGYITENSGTATLLNTTMSIAVNHGLSTTPTNITITWLEDPTNAIGDWWVDTIGAAQFTLHGVDPGASNLDFRWTANAW